MYSGGGRRKLRLISEFRNLVGKLYWVEALMNNGERKTLPNCKELSFSPLIKYAAKVFNLSILQR